jgi:hypothetical protein
MTNRITAREAQAWARLAGALYLVIIVLGAVEEIFIRGRIVVAGDAVATAANLRAMEPLWRLGIASELFLGICTIVQAVALYVLLRPVQRELALLATFFNFVAIAVETATSLRLIEALYPLGRGAYLSAFSPDQLATLSLLASRAHAHGFGIALLYFGPFFLLAGWLIMRSGYLPRVIGMLYFLPGVAYLASSFALILAPGFAERFYFEMAGPAVIGEGALCLWLLTRGISRSNWDKIVGVVPEGNA